MFCSQCGSANDDSASFCKECDRAVDINKFSGMPIRKLHTGRYVTFVLAVKLYLANILQFKGRATRSEYWWACLFRYTITLFLGVLALISYEIIGSEDVGTVFILLAIIHWVVDKYLLSIPIIVRRLHDSGNSGFHCFWPALPFIGVIILLMMMVAKSSPEHNKYCEFWSDCG